MSKPHSDLDTRTRNAGPTAPGGAAERHLALTILGHPKAARIGDRATLIGLAAGETVSISRSAPNFATPGARNPPEPLGDPFLSRSAAAEIAMRDGAVSVRRGPAGSAVTADAELIAERRTFSPPELDRGVVLEVGDRVVLLLHFVDAVRAKPPPRFDLVGESDAMDALRRSIALAAPTEMRVLVRGPTGTGKELVARAIHKASALTRGPFEAVNMATVGPNLAASALFGHVRGAFSGAVTDHEGHFAMANGGTLFLDEIGDTEPAVQAMLLRALETGEFQRVGDRRVQKASVRLVSATDADLEAAVNAGKFREPLLHRVAELSLSVPPLAARRDDIGRLMIHFMRELLDKDEQARLLDGPVGERPWLAAHVIAKLARAPWTGNVRQLRNVARQLCVLHRSEDTIAWSPALDALVGTARQAETAPPLVASVAPAATSEAPAKRPQDLSETEILDALEASGWRRARAAQRLGIARSSLYARMAELPGISRAHDLTEPQIRASLSKHEGDLEAAASALCISPHGLKLRMRALGVEEGAPGISGGRGPRRGS